MADARTTAFEALDNALSGGFFEPGQTLHRATAAELAADLRAYDAASEAFTEAELEPHAEEWLLVNPKARR